MNISKLERTEPESQILYRLKYRGEVVGAEQGLGVTAVFFVVELDPFGLRSVYWDSEPEGLSTSERVQVLEVLQGLADDDKLPR